MKKKLNSTILLSSLLLSALVGCEKEANAELYNEGENINFISVACDRIGVEILYEFKDKETGVHYVFTPGGGISVMYNKDGSIKAD